MQSAIVCADVNEACVIPTRELVPLFDLDINWNTAASSPADRLIGAVIEITSQARVFLMTDARECEGFRVELLRAEGQEHPKKLVTRFNFCEVYDHWCKVIGCRFTPELRSAAFLADLSNDPLITAFSEVKNRLQVTLDGTAHTLSVSKRDYSRFWSIWDRPPEVAEFQYLISQADRLRDMAERRRKGMFYTPPKVARLGLSYLDEVLGEGWKVS